MHSRISKLAVVLLCVAGLLANVHAQTVVGQVGQRPFPSDAKIGILSPSAAPTILINGQVRQLTAGAQIRNENNLIVQPMTLAGPDVRIVYKVNGQSQIERIWILNTTEAQQIQTTIPPSMLYVSPTGITLTVPTPSN
jgi:hypothetical protein